MIAKQIAVREATLEDRKALWEWYNEPLRRIAFSKDQLISYEQHCLWYENIRNDGNRFFCVCIEDTLRIGVVRFDGTADMEYEVHFYLKPSYCGKGYGVRILKESIDYLLKSRGFRKLFIDFKKPGPSSQGIFMKAGFNLVSEGESVLHWELNLK